MSATTRRKALDLIAKGDNYLRNRDFDNAEKMYRDALKLDPSCPEAAYSIGFIYIERGELQRTLEWAKRAIEIDSGYNRGHHLLGNALLGLQRYEEALNELNISLEKEPNPSVLGQIGMCYESLDRLEEAEKYYRLALKNDPGYITRFASLARYSHNSLSADLHHFLARVLQKQNKLDEAKLCYHLAKRIDPTIELDPMFLEIMSETDLEDHPAEKQIDITNTSSSIDKLRIFLDKSDYQELVESVQELKDDNLFPEVVAFIESFQKNGDYYHSSFLRVVGDILDGKDSSALFSALQSYVWKFLFELAQRLYSKSIDKKEAYATAESLDFDWETSKTLLQLTNRFVRFDSKSGLVLALVVQHLMSKSSSRIDGAKASMLLSIAYKLENMLDNAVEMMHSALEIFKMEGDIDGQMESHYRLAEIYSDLKKYEMALTCRETFISIAERNGRIKDVIDGRYNYARTLFLSGRINECYDQCMMVVDLLKRGPPHEIAKGLYQYVSDLIIRSCHAKGMQIPQKVLGYLEKKSLEETDPVTTNCKRAAFEKEKNNLEASLSLLEEAKNEAISNDYPFETLVNILVEIADVNCRMNHLENARDSLLYALSLGESIRDKFDIWYILFNLADISRQLGYTDEAIEYAERGVQEARLKRSEGQEIESLKYLSNLLLKKDSQRAVELYGKVIDLQKKKTPQLYEQALRYIQGGNLSEARHILERLAIDKTNELQQFKAEIFANLGIVYIKLENFDKAVSYLETSATKFLEHGDQEQAINVLRRLSILYHLKGKEFNKTIMQMFDIWDMIKNSGLRRSIGVQLASTCADLFFIQLAEEIASECLRISRSKKWRDVNDELGCHKVLGRVCRHTSRYKEAVKHYLSALACASYLNDEQEVGLIRGWLAIVFRYLGEWDEAIEQYNLSIKTADQNHDLSTSAISRMNLSILLFLVGKDHDALNEASRSLQVFDSLGHEREAHQVLSIIVEHSDFNTLDNELKKRLELFLQHGIDVPSSVSKAWYEMKLAQILAAKGQNQHQRAIHLINESIASYAVNGPPVTLASSLITRANLIKNYKPKQAIDDATKAHEIAIRNDQLKIASDCQKFLLEISLQNKDSKKIIEHLNLLLSEWIRMRRMLRNDKYRINFADSVAKTITTCVNYFIQAGDSVRAFEIQEWGRSQSLTDLLVYSNITRKKPHTNRKQFEKLAKKEDETVKSLIEKDADILSGSISEVIDDADKVDKSTINLNDLETHLNQTYENLAKHDVYYALQKQGASVTFSEAKQVLSGLSLDSIAITFSLIDDEVIVMALHPDSDKPSIYSTKIGRNDLRDLIKNFNQDVRNWENDGSQSSVWRNKANNLLIDVSREIRKNDLVLIIADGELQNLPLHSLTLPTGQLLMEYATVIYEPNLTILKYLHTSNQKVKQKPYDKLLTVGVAFPDEARAIAISFGGKCLSGNNISKDSLCKEIGNNSIVHLSCHGFFDRERSLESGLLLANTDTPLTENILSLRDLLNWRFDTSLIVLSVCESGLGEATPSEFLGLSRAILAAGVRSVIVALWKLDSVITQNFMLEFYRELSRQKEKNHRLDLAKALKLTQKKFSRSPLYEWAGFKLIGLPTIPWSTISN